MSEPKINDADAPIGVFDSGIGGLTVVSELFRRLPDEEIVYLGDTARYPYGTRSPERIRALAMENSSFLMDFDVKMIVVACNTVSSVALDELVDRLPVPVVGVVKPGAYLAARTTRNGKIGVIGTAATIASKSYVSEIKLLNDRIEVLQKACSLLVSLAEEGWTVGPVPRMVAETYLGDLRLTGIDTLVLGCTHYPLLKSVIGETMGEGIRLVDSAEAGAGEVARLLEKQSAFRTDKRSVTHKFIVTDSPGRFEGIGEAFLGQPLGKVLKVTLEESR